MARYPRHNEQILNFCGTWICNFSINKHSVFVDANTCTWGPLLPALGHINCLFWVVCGFQVMQVVTIGKWFQISRQMPKWMFLSCQMVLNIFKHSKAPVVQQEPWTAHLARGPAPALSGAPMATRDNTWLGGPDMSAPEMPQSNPVAAIEKLVIRAEKYRGLPGTWSEKVQKNDGIVIWEVVEDNDDAWTLNNCTGKTSTLAVEHTMRDNLETLRFCPTPKQTWVIAMFLHRLPRRHGKHKHTGVINCLCCVVGTWTMSASTFAAQSFQVSPHNGQQSLTIGTIMSSTHLTSTTAETHSIPMVPWCLHLL
jgi:hypothetical protein